MSERGRLLMLLAAFVLLTPLVWRLAGAMPLFGEAITAYGRTINALVPGARNVSNMIAAINFDVRGIDTVGEELMLLAATTGATILLRGARGEDASERAGRVPGRPSTPRADATVLVSRIAAPALILFGLYVILHGTVTPGGGFQGGVIVTSGLLVVYLGDGYRPWRQVVRGPVFALLEGGGALVFVLAALVPLALGEAALANTLPLGQWKDLFSGGLMQVGNAAVGAAVTGGFALLLLEFLEETRAPADDDMPDEESR